MWTLILTIALSCAGALGFWLCASWVVFHTARKRVETAVLATGQAYTTPRLTSVPIRARRRRPIRPIDQRSKNAGLTHDDTAVAYAYHLLGWWQCIALRAALLRWDLSPWLDGEIESAVYRFKHTGRLPASQQTMALHDSHLDWLTGRVGDLADVFTRQMSRDLQPEIFWPGDSVRPSSDLCRSRSPDLPKIRLPNR